MERPQVGASNLATPSPRRKHAARAGTERLDRCGAHVTELIAADDGRRTAAVSKWCAPMCQRGAKRILLHSSYLQLRTISSSRQTQVR